MLARLFSRLTPTTSVWIRGENAAARHMRRQGCRVIARNLRLSMGEIDLLCEDPGSRTLIVVEVKARLSKPNDTRRIDPESGITSAKKTKLRTLATALTKRTEYQGRPIRIDVIAVVFRDGSKKPAELRHYESAV